MSILTLNKVLSTPKCPVLFFIFCGPPQAYCQEHRHRQDEGQIKLPAAKKRIGADEKKNGKPDEFAEDMQLVEITEGNPHQKGKYT